MNIEEVAAAFDKPVSHIEAIARGYSQTGHESRPIPTDFDLIESYHAAELGGTHVVIRQQQLLAGGQEIYLASSAVEHCENAETAKRRADELNRTHLGR